jgi:hypothetical protein
MERTNMIYHEGYFFFLHLITVPYISCNIKSNKTDNSDKIIIARLGMLVTL